MDTRAARAAAARSHDHQSAIAEEVMLHSSRFRLCLTIGALSLPCVGNAAPIISRLTPPSELFASGNPQPMVSRFVAGQRFDLQATVRPEADSAIKEVRFSVDGKP